MCIEHERVLLTRYVPRDGAGSWWTLPGGGVELGEDPFDAVLREVAEETGCDAAVERLLGVDSRVIPAAEHRVPAARPGLDTNLRRPAPSPVGGLIEH